ncbi:hypothetical protein KAFR_0A04510 [Kazachstania africana CBS 2517]|uniref:DNA replication regulator Sld3 C-terminal domain-containing protein n=1 Tax=Kazachstania africana (strain ATCC 22294 / BCRC 22015 / CBS 2517 / CECT 1963 / NBRC 1671 / NRRL Y-8276) TaxID=1071382 RepID=H2AND6_KAZAF|nr:hypothetical protein KAFR_0A04510 [Kazachstania africana CBS 2517]CCF55886.1 hypothetical protein KAFR_0A04510 [Kazachstania africana CBS 2517]
MQEWKLLGSVKVIPRSTVIDSSSPLVLQANEIPHHISTTLKHLPLYLKHLLKDASSNSYFFLERYGSQYWIYWRVTTVHVNDFQYEDTKMANGRPYDQGTIANWSEYSIEKLLENWSHNIASNASSSTSQGKKVKINMRPPNAKIDGRQSIKPNDIPHTPLDPKDYFEQKYYDALFSIKLPLAYFVKSNLVRFKNICMAVSGEEYNLQYQSILSQFLLHVQDFDKRYEKTSVINETYLLPSFALQSRDKLLSEYNQSKNTPTFDALMNDLMLIVKAREIKLQLILLLEIIHQNTLDKKFKNFELNYESKLKRRAVNVTRRTRAKKNSYNISSTANAFGSGSASVDYCEQLDIYLDKLSILEILLETENSLSNENSEELNPIQEYKKNILNKNKEASSVGFVSYILIPYYTKKVPYAVTFILRKLKGPSLKAKKPISNKSVNNDGTDTTWSESKHFQQTNNNDLASTAISTTSNLYSVSSRPTLNRHLTSGSLVPSLLNARTNSNLSELLEADSQSLRHPSSLSRTTSDLTMNNLQKRQLSVSDFASADKKEGMSLKGGKVSTLSQSSRKVAAIPTNNTHSFRRVGKLKSTKSFTKSYQFESQNQIDETDVIQVTATPLSKPSRNNIHGRQYSENLVESPMNSIISSGGSNKAHLPDHFVSPTNLQTHSSIRITQTPSFKDRTTRSYMRATHLEKVQEFPAAEYIEKTPKDDMPKTPKIELIEEQQPQKKKVRRRLFAP